MKILVVEDTYPSLYLIQSLLSGGGFEVVTAENGCLALERLRDEAVDLIVSDVLMPQMDGFQLCREVKATPALRNIPFLIYTATYTAAEDATFARSLGADGFLVKPTDAAQLLGTIRTLIQRGAAGKSLPPVVAPAEPVEDLDYFKQYNVRLIKKLESKVEQLDDANRRLRKSDDQFHTLAQFAPVGIFRLDPDGHLLYANAHWHELTGLSAEDTCQSSWLAALHPDDREQVARDWHAALTAQQAFQAEFRFLHADGSITWILGQARPIPPSADEEGAYIGAFTDVTRHKRLEEEHVELQARLHQAQKLEAIGTMVGGIAHDFNNLLGAILGYAELAQHALPVGVQVHDDLSQLIRAAQRARDLTQQILWFSRKRKETFKAIQIAPIVREAIRLLRVRAPAHVALVETIPADLPNVPAHPTQIHQIVSNLVTNAFHALGDRSGAVRVSLEAVRVDADLAGRLPELRRGTYLALIVRDTGTGIPAEVLPRIFDPFFTTKPPGEGTGMGLSVVHGIVKEHGGAIDVASEPGKGTTFTVYFPATEENVEKTSAIPEGDGARLLFVDDEDLLLRMAVRMLERLRYQVTSFTDPAEALAAFHAEPGRFDLVLTDLDMPHLTGLELAAELAKVRPELPIVLTTGVKQPFEPAKARSLGIRELLLKPFDYRGLADVLARALRSAQSA
jgi:PAS domain S-box-containing protein